MQTDLEKLKAELKIQARELGFVACGVAAAGASQTVSHLEKWLQNGFAASMDWMKKPDSVEKRGDVRKLFPGARSVICVAMLYRTDENYDAQKNGEIARYARGDDYHDFMPARLRQLLNWLQTRIPCEGRAFVDTAPILEREWAQRAGIGWIGKNSLLMSRSFGSYVLLGEIVTDLKIAPDDAHVEEFCGTCTRCLDACPTQAIVAPRVIDSNRCIAFHTIENRKIAPLELRENFGDQVFGCDICQQVCPWNQKTERDGVFSTESSLWTRSQMPELREWVEISQEEFSRRLKNSPIKRAKRRGMKRNATRALKNRKLES